MKRNSTLNQSSGQNSKFKTYFLSTVYCLLSTLFALLFLSCGREAPPLWPWWTKEDSLAVQQELAKWKSVLTQTLFVYGVKTIPTLSRVHRKDSTSITGDSLQKIQHITSVKDSLIQSFHSDSFQFGVTTDTVALTDTFCEVTFKDSLALFGLINYDTLWMLKYQQDTIIDTTKVPPETSYVWLLDTLEKRPKIGDVGKYYSASAMRKLHFKKVSSEYKLNRLTGFAVFIPEPDSAPKIQYVAFSKPGKTDTFYYAPRKDLKGLYNLRHIDSLYTLKKDEPIEVTVSTTTPEDTAIDRNFFFLQIMGGAKTNISTSDPKSGTGTVRFPDTGIKHLNIEVVPASALYYPKTVYKATIWAIPVKVISP